MFAEAFGHVSDHRLPARFQKGADAVRVHAGVVENRQQRQSAAADLHPPMIAGGHVARAPHQLREAHVLALVVGGDGYGYFGFPAGSTIFGILLLKEEEEIINYDIDGDDGDGPGNKDKGVSHREDSRKGL